MNTTAFSMSRRGMLRAAGVCLGLPLLPSLGRWSRAADKPPEVPRRLAFLYIPNGVNVEAWSVTGSGEKVKAAVINIIPPQKAGVIAHQAGCAEGDWCPVKPDSFASAKVSDIYVLGDASVAPAAGMAPNEVIHAFEADHWLADGLLKPGLFAPEIESNDVSNHSWINYADGGAPAGSLNDLLRRLDFSIERDDYLCVAGLNNGVATAVPDMLTAKSARAPRAEVAMPDSTGTGGVSLSASRGRSKPTMRIDSPARYRRWPEDK